MTMPRSWSRFEFKTDPENGCLIGPDGCHYNNEKAAYHFGFFHLCGCGSPEEAYNFCLDALRCFDRRASQEDPHKHPWVDAESELKKLILARPDEAAHVLAHLLTHLDVLEHGGSVGGSWLTEWGKQIVDAGPVGGTDLD